MPFHYISTLKHPNIYSYNLLFSKFVQINGPEISESKSRFPDKNNLYAYLLICQSFDVFFCTVCLLSCSIVILNSELLNAHVALAVALTFTPLGFTSLVWEGPKTSSCQA